MPPSDDVPRRRPGRRPADDEEDDRPVRRPRDEDEDEEEDDRPVRRKRRKSGGGTSPLLAAGLIGGAVLLLVCCGGGGVALYLWGPFGNVATITSASRTQARDGGTDMVEVHFTPRAGDPGQSYVVVARVGAATSVMAGNLKIGRSGRARVSWSTRELNRERGSVEVWIARDAGGGRPGDRVSNVYVIP